MYFLAAARFRFQSPLFLICSNFPVILRFSMNSTRRLQRWFVSKLGPSPVTTAAKPFFSIFSDTTRSVPPLIIQTQGRTFFRRVLRLRKERKAPGTRLHKDYIRRSTFALKREESLLRLPQEYPCLRWWSAQCSRERNDPRPGLAILDFRYSRERVLTRLLYD